MPPATAVASNPKQQNPQQQQKPEPVIRFQRFFKSMGPRTYAAQIKEWSNGNPFLVLTEGKRDLKTGELRKSHLFINSEDFPAFFRMLHETAQYLKANPVPEEIKKRRQRYWEKQAKEAEQGKGSPDRAPASAQSPAKSRQTRAPRT
jgi:hypothetical protein